ncbi:MAG: lysoplasmalogenase [Saprospiraceae bacterium]|nr:lysoplasmalogenase [Saprospiraceae bacterium]MBP7699566.1 lysoplasmalogenase [Saprospiraceae bacterium]
MPNLIFKKDHWLTSYGILSIIHLLARLFEFQRLGDYTKPFLMILLAGYFYRSTRQSFTPFAKLILAALLLSCWGDTFLISDSEVNFMLGLGGFLIAQICYTIAFGTYKIRHPKPFLFLSLIFIGLLIWMDTYLWHWLAKNLRTPVVLYSIVITIMVIVVYQLKSQLPPIFFWRLFLGVCLFYLSDTMLALNKFTPLHIPFVGFWVMLTYLLAQGLITWSSVRINQLLHQSSNQSL